MELADITNDKEFLAQLSIYGTIAEDLADRLQDIKKTEIGRNHINDELDKSVNDVQSLLYQAARKIGEITDVQEA
ncbi:hypothetical protein QYC35_09980 [Ligilactobacillus salivarius]|uniref:Phosphate transport system regulatory protein PhoU n=1 Tax=Ligilactobacillus salivarius TaxID=1624 RepID=A0AAW7N9Z6_9LACO|nr:hypothetical protein [Ligilactobacillus salivarius]MDN4834507.1 hypothetical protein [Ligilactobacillus salivarius]